MLRDDLVVKIESVLTMGVEVGMMGTKDLGEYMYEHVCPICSAEIDCPVPEAYKMMMEGADQKAVDAKMRSIGKALGVKIPEIPDKCTPNFLKINTR